MVSEQIAGRDPFVKRIVEAVSARQPDWTDEQITERISREPTWPVVTVEEVAHWRAAS